MHLHSPLMFLLIISVLTASLAACDSAPDSSTPDATVDTWIDDDTQGPTGDTWTEDTQPPTGDTWVEDTLSPGDVLGDVEETTPDILNDSEEEGDPRIHVEALEDGQAGTGTKEDPYRKLQMAIDAAPDGATLQIHPGTYSAWPVAYNDPGCGNCDDASYSSGAKASRGFLIADKALHLVGDDKDTVILDTNAGYGVLFINAGDSSVRTLTITGGMRDADGQATDGGIVVKYTTLLIEDVLVIENDSLYEGPLEDPVVGVCGIVGREGADLTIRNSIIEDNSWDGIAFYRSPPDDPDANAKGTIEGCRIGCTSECVSKRGRGVGIGVTWDAKVTAIGNVVHHYWKGIGSFGNTTVTLHNNIIRDQVGWGIIASGDSTMLATNNVITRNGTTALSAWNWGAKGSFINNIIYANGTSADEWVGVKAGIWFNADPNVFQLTYNLAFDNANINACEGGAPNGAPCSAIPFEGVDGNLVGDPLFVGENDFHLQPGSPAIDAGDPLLPDLDNSASDMGVYGGPFAPESLP